MTQMRLTYNPAYARVILKSACSASRRSPPPARTSKSAGSLHSVRTRMAGVIPRAPQRRQHQIPSDSIRIGSTDVQPVTSIRDLGVYIDADMTMRTHVQLLSEHVSLLYVKSGAFGDLCHLMPC